MGGLIDDNDLRELKERVNIIDIVAQQVVLKKAGRSYKGLCPFHQEKTPSFTVDPQRQLYHCFGCGEGGDVFSFLMKTEGLDFNEAAEALADRAGFRLHYRSGSGRGDKGARQRLYKLNAAAADFYHRTLLSPAGDQARAYLKKRGFNREIAENLNLGYAPAGWGELKSKLTAAGFQTGEMLKAGLLSEKEGRVYDRFRGRLIFPIHDIQGRVVAFGGRILSTGEPKYLNSPETPVYHKSSTLYGLYQAKTHIIKASKVLVVEGYTDLAALLLNGFGNVVATCGTAFTLEHFKLLSRFAEEIIFVFDGDAAGVAAAERGLELVPRLRLPSREALKGLVNARQVGVSVALLPAGSDPAEYLAAAGAAGFRGVIDKAEPFTDFYLNRLLAKFDLNDHHQRRQATARALAFIRSLDSAVDQEVYLKKTAAAVGVSLNTLQLDLRKTPVGGGRVPAGSKGKEQRSAARTGNAAGAAEREMLKLILQNPDKSAYLSELEPSDWQSPDYKHLFTVLKSKLVGKGMVDARNIVLTLAESEKKLAAALMLEPVIATDLDRYFLSIFCRLKEIALARRIKELIAELGEAAADKQDSIERMIVELQNKRRELRKQVV